MKSSAAMNALVAAPSATSENPANAAAQTDPPPVAAALAGRSTDNAVIRLRCTRPTPDGQCALPSKHDGGCTATPDDRVVAVTSPSTVLVPAASLDAHTEALPLRGAGR